MVYIDSGPSKRAIHLSQVQQVFSKLTTELLTKKNLKTEKKEFVEMAAVITMTFCLEL